MVVKSVDQLQEGMVVAKPVIIQGRALLMEGSHLTAKHIQILKTWGVAEVWIEGGEELQAESAPGPEDPALLPIRQKIELRFSKCLTGSEVIAVLKSIVFRRECMKSGIITGKKLS